RQSMIRELLFPSSILAVKLNRKSLVIVLEMEIYVYDISDMRLLHAIETTPNPEAICALSPSADSSYLAYPSPVLSPMCLATAANGSPSTASGDVLLFSTRTFTVANVIQAHKSPLSLPSINSTGSLLATSSDKGTVIRVWSIPGAEKLYQFRRGTREASVHDTVHIFKLGQQPTSKNNSEASNLNQSSSSPPESVEGASPPPSLEGGYNHSSKRKRARLTKSLTHSMGGYLPNSLTEMWEPSRDFASLRTMSHVMVISSDGYFYSYSIDLAKGEVLLDSGEESSVLDGK
ncbi:hypothetical protein BYT27DRAFT_7199888, partial [Phlegmacium glaucopus]